MPPDLRLFRYAVAVADEGGFGRAAARLGIAQPPLSQQIKRLEEGLGLTLFDRVPGGAVPTAAGAIFLDAARKALRESERAIETAQQAARGEIGALAIGLAGGTMFSFLPRLLRKFRLAFPSLSLNLHNLAPDEQMERLTAGKIDVGFSRIAPAPDGVVLELAHVKSFVAALPTPHPLAPRRQLLLKDMAAEPFVMFPHQQRGGFHAEVVGLCHAAGFAPRIEQEIAPMHAVIGLVGAGLGVSVVPHSVMALRMPGVVYRPLRGLEAQSRIFLVSRPASLSPVARAFVDFARTYLAGASLGTGQIGRRS